MALSVNRVRALTRRSRVLVVVAFGCSTSPGVIGGLVADRHGNEQGADSGGSSSESCALTSPLATFSNNSTCLGRLASTVFTNALCVCNNLELTSFLATRGFDSTQGPYQAGQLDDSGAAVGVNGNCNALVGSTDIAGSFAVAGQSDLQIIGSLSVRGDFRAAGNTSVTGAVKVERAAWLAGNFSALGPFSVGDSLHHTGTVFAVPLLVPTNRQETVTVENPCPCDASGLVDIAPLVDASKSANDNDRDGVTSDALTSVLGAADLALSCGRFYLTGINGTGNIVVHVAGMTAVYVDGSIAVDGALTFDLAPGAELDVLVKQDVNVVGAIALSSRERPAAGRLWVNGNQPIRLDGSLVGNLYAPHAVVSSAVALEVWGSVFASGFTGGAYASFFFDRAVGEAGLNCSAPRPPVGICSRCQWCSAGAACVAGECGACTSDSDCCSQTVCVNGKCAPLVLVRPG